MELCRRTRPTTSSSAGTTYTDTFTVTAADGTRTSVTVTIHGTNDAAVLSSADGVNLTETNAALADLRDADHQRRRTAGDLRGADGTAGTLRHVLDRHRRRMDAMSTNSAHDEFVGGTTYTDTFAVTAADGTVNLGDGRHLGTNDAAVLSSADGSTGRDERRACRLRDADHHRRRQPGDLRGADGRPATLTARSRSAPTARGPTSTNSAHDEFAAGPTHTDTFDGEGADGTTNSVTVHILGTNDAPGAVSLDVTLIAEGAQGGDVVGLLTAADVDAGDTHTFTLTDADGNATRQMPCSRSRADGKTLVVKAGVTLDEC